MSQYKFFATTPKAMEDLLSDELKQLGAKNVKPVIAGASFEGDISVAYRACLWSRIANRILLHVHTFEVYTQDDLYDGIKKINWSEHLNPENSFAVTFTVKNSPVITHSHFGALKVKDGIVDQMREKFQKRPNVDIERPDVRVNVRLQNQTAQVGIDLSGASLHQRRYRDNTVEAPIKENLAAAMLVKSAWPEIAKSGGTLLDPMCGSGTLLIEAAMIAGDFAPGLLRDYFGFLGWKQHDEGCWRNLREEARKRKLAGSEKIPAIAGYDRNRKAIAAAKANVGNAGFQHKICLECREIGDIEPAPSWQPGLIIGNPPYGERLGTTDQAIELYERLGEILKSRFTGWKSAFIVSDLESGFRFGIRSQKPVTLFNGALECKLLRMDIEPATFFKPKPKTREESIDRYLATDPEQLTSPENGAEMFANRLLKNFKKLTKWANLNQIACFRLYDADLPEFAVAVDLFRGKDNYVVVQEYEPPKTIDPMKADRRLAGALAVIPQTLDVAKSNVFLKFRRQQKSTEQYEKLAETGSFHIVEEGGCKFWVNFTDYLDTGLFLDHRPLRRRLQQESQGKRFLNLFCYTGSATIHAIKGGAASSTSVDLSQTYLNWAKRNLDLNGFSGNHEFIQADCMQWLAQEAEMRYCRQYDLIFLDPPTFSNSKRMQDIFDIQRDHIELIRHASTLLGQDGVLYFSTNFRRFKLNQGLLEDLCIEDISVSTIPEDFARNPKIHYCWKITKSCVE